MNPFKSSGKGLLPRNTEVKMQIGDWVGENVKIDYPTLEKFRGFRKDFIENKALDDWEVWMHGAFPDRRTKDIDFILTKGEGVPLDPEEMESLSYAAFDKSIRDRNFLADLGFHDQKINSFDSYMNHWLKTKETVPVTAFLPGDKWYVNDRLFKDRSRGLKMVNGGRGKVASVGNNMSKIWGELPYAKLIKSLEDDSFHVYTQKPIKIKSRKGRY
tara:strand:- start:303 stop:947 length:645 start_codon:yes stop_codon:yes gene_type:complete